MNTNRAIKIITNCVQTDKMTREQDLALATLQKLVEKAKPRKILYKRDDLILCPTCKTIACEDEFDNYNFCPYCGQALADDEEL